MDGDTVILLVDLGFGITLTETVRLEKINAPELREGDTALRVKTRLRELLEGHKLHFLSVSYDRYHRSVGRITFADSDETRTISQILLDEGLVTPYVK